MSEVYRIYGVELSPYSVKVRSYFRYKRIPHEWIIRGMSVMEEYKKIAKLPLIPAVALPEGGGLQDSTPIIETMEARFPEPSIHPANPALAFLSALLEEFGDEWGNKWMFHYRWAREVDQLSAADRIAQATLGDVPREQIEAMAVGIRERMVSRVWFVGSNPQTAGQIEESFCASMKQLGAHLADRPYLFGACPAFADFGLWGQIYTAWTDPTPRKLIEELAPAVVAWIERMLDPKATGDFESWNALEPTLAPLLKQQVGALFLPWSLANARAMAAGEEEFSVELPSGTWTQKPQKYHAKSLMALRQRYAAVTERDELDRILAACACLEPLRD